ncbi:peptide/nickel transport system permease protein [Antricoccus suffuscus]|uniref:Peptide/nickel transport system permease protein n=1 Tax=Antricoccus suffuscus TaxID=1629062 RepID=A0A2T1A601_9ACTN|nr:ABC transporter permease [Antricoccus suffuscus]PRZ44042.1 peptide/nickel transport system permease protein [Antricoccus suffuscus]
MLRIALSRLLALIPLLVIASFVAFLLLQLTSTDPAVVRLGDNATSEAYAAFRHEIGVDRPVLVQYGSWLLGAVHGDLGTSWSNSTPVIDSLMTRLPVTLSISVAALVVGLVIGIPTGIAAGIRAGRSSDSLLTGGASLGQAIPSFWLALLLVAYVAMKTPWFPATGYVPFAQDPGGWLRSITLPSIALGAAAAGAFARQTRAGFVQVLHEPYVRATVAGGLTRRRILWRTALRNASIPVVTIIAGQAAVLVGGAVVIEQVFALPGLGQLVLNAIHNGDIPVVLGFVALMALLVAVIQFLLDLAYALIDPRIRAA